jgi:hypothetical protein
VKKLSSNAWGAIAVVVVSLSILFTVTVANCRSVEHLCWTPHISTDPKGPNWAEILTALLTVVLAGAAIFALSAVSESRRARNAVQMTDLSRRWDDEINREVRRLVVEYATKGVDSLNPIMISEPERLKISVMKRREENHEDYRKLLTEPNFLEDIAIMVQRGGMDFDLVNLSLGFSVPYRWSLWKPTIDELRRVDREPLIYKEFEWLARRIAAKNPHSVELDEDGEVVWEGLRE